MPEDFNKKLKEWQQIQVLNNSFWYIPKKIIKESSRVLQYKVKFGPGSKARNKDT
jgi:hypothetical protein